MMLLFFADDRSKRRRGFWIDRIENLELLVHVPQDDALDSDRRGGNGLAAGEAGERAQDEPAQPAPEVAPAGASSATLELRGETRAVSALMGEEMIELSHHVRRPPTGKPSLRAIDAHGAMLPRVIDLHNSVAQRLARSQPRRQCHDRSLSWRRSRRNGHAGETC